MVGSIVYAIAHRMTDACRMREFLPVNAQSLHAFMCMCACMRMWVGGSEM